MQQMVPVLMAGPQDGRVVQVPMQNASGLQKHSVICYKLVPVQVELHQLPHPDMLQQQHLQQMQIPPSKPAPPPGWFGQPEQQGVSMPQGRTVYGHSQQREMRVPRPLPSSADGLAAGIRQGSERMWANEEETMHGWQHGSRLPERSWAEMSEQGQSHGPMLRDRPPMRGQLLATSPMGTRIATEDRLTIKAPALPPGSAQMQWSGNTMFGGTRADRQQGKVDCSLDQDCPKTDFNLTNMKAQLQALLNEDPSTVVIARRVNKLGFSSADYLRTHFLFYGEVKNVYVCHSRVKINLPKKLRCERRSSDPRQRLRPASLAFVVMASADAAARILTDGPDHTIKGVTVFMQDFQRRERAESVAGQAGENNEVTDASALEIDAADYPRWPSPYSETEGDNDQPPQTLLDGPLPLSAENAASDDATELASL